MLNTIENKWKRFAVCQVLSDWDELDDGASLYNLIAETADDDLERLFDEYNVIVWQQFDNLPLFDVACQITELATRAQETAYSV